MKRNVIFNADIRVDEIDTSGSEDTFRVRDESRRCFYAIFGPEVVLTQNMGDRKTPESAKTATAARPRSPESRR